MSYPFYDKEFTYTQPDGTEIRVKGWGDQHHAVFALADVGQAALEQRGHPAPLLVVRVDLLGGAEGLLVERVDLEDLLISRSGPQGAPDPVLPDGGHLQQRFDALGAGL